MSEQNPGFEAEFVGGLDREQREFITKIVSEQFGWITAIDLASATGMSVDEVHGRIDDKQVVGFEIDGEQRFPGFTVADKSINLVIAYAVQELDPALSDWEKLLWLCASNGELDGLRPVDVTFDEMKRAVAEELCY